MSDQEEARAKQLEEARKRVEELRKKSKKDKKKKKQNKTAEESGEQRDSEDLGKESTSELPEDTNTNEEENVDKHDDKQTEVNEQSVESPVKSADRESARGSEEKVLKSAPETADSKESTDDASQLFEGDNNGESDFMESIKKQQEVDEIQKLKTELEKSVEASKKLKFINMEHETTIEDLQSEVEELRSQLQKSQQELQSAIENLTAAQHKLSLQEQREGTPNFQFAQFNVPGTTNQETAHSAHQEVSNEPYRPEIDRNALNRWRCWNVDMTSWRSIGNGPVFEF